MASSSSTTSSTNTNSVLGKRPNDGESSDDEVKEMKRPRINENQIYSTDEQLESSDILSLHPNPDIILTHGSGVKLKASKAILMMHFDFFITHFNKYKDCTMYEFIDTTERWHVFIRMIKEVYASAVRGALLLININNMDILMLEMYEQYGLKIELLGRMVSGSIQNQVKIRDVLVRSNLERILSFTDFNGAICDGSMTENDIKTNNKQIVQLGNFAHVYKTWSSNEIFNLFIDAITKMINCMRKNTKTPYVYKLFLETSEDHIKSIVCPIMVKSLINV